MDMDEARGKQSEELGEHEKMEVDLDRSKDTKKEAKNERKFSIFKRSKSLSEKISAPSAPASAPPDSSSAQNFVQRRSSSSMASSAWDISQHVLTTLTNAAQYAPTPYIGTLASVTLSIFTAVQGAKDNKDALKQLASLTYNLTITVTSTYKDIHPSAEHSESFSNDPDLNRHVKELVSKLEEIKDFIENQASRPLLRRVVSSGSDLNIIQDYRDQLRHALDAFSIQSSITLRGTMSKVASQQETMMRFPRIFKAIPNRALLKSRMSLRRCRRSHWYRYPNPSQKGEPSRSLPLKQILGSQ
ncbi:hypothetical protein BT96DRAFT_96875 [Gymnopus androsaceus JB14]|uniref:Uncharacterized protein n=1 Tax=Gymnopus androsaceus JB14 TaxID=1447944 RepID=A0A6A4HHZ9_9AGAR|nr:hypothetical protein BT96DRAFT_96875 [Gymnopus androsaceus JB14]